VVRWADSLAIVQPATVIGCVTILRLPARSPNLNAFAERFVGSIKQECLRQIVPLGEHHLRRTVGEFVAHYHSERNHSDESGPIRRRDRLGGGFVPRAAEIGWRRTTDYAAFCESSTDLEMSAAS
jgi:hypothetical protein